MKLWTSQHAALLLALRAERLIPKLFKRLSLERYEATEADLRRLSEWPSELARQPGWALIEPVLDEPGAWPDAWERAREAGFSPTCDHHHALLFSRLTSSFVRDHEYEHARWAWREAIEAWRRVMASGYPRELLDDLIDQREDTSPELERAREHVITTLLDPLFDEHIDRLRAALGLGNDKLGALDRRVARFSWSALGQARKSLRDDALLGQDLFGTLAHARQRATSARVQIAVEAVERFKKLAEQLDASETPGPELLGPFEWAAQTFELIGHTEYASTTIVTQAVQFAWRLRKVGRDEEAEFFRLFDIVEPFNKDLYARLERHDTFGHNSKCADFIVFRGEPLLEHRERRALFERALAICPGHRNASMLMSYEHLHEANQAIGQAQLILAPMRHIPGNDKPSQLINKAWEALDRARAVFPTNEKIPDYEQRIRDEATRLRVDLPE